MMSRIAIRIDDICENMDWDRFLRFQKILDDNGICPLIGIVPNNRDKMLMGTVNENYKAWLCERKAMGWVMAMHGYDHCYTTKKAGLFPLNRFSEFAGVPYEQQLDKIGKGVSRLEELGVTTDVFMAPAHSFDSYTVKALKQYGFKYITDGFGSTPYAYKGMIYLPISFKKSRELGKAGGYTTFVYHTATMNDREFEAFESFVREYRDSIINYGEYMDAEVVSGNALWRCREWCMASLKRVLVKIKK